MAQRPNTLSARWTTRRGEGPSFGLRGDLLYERGDGIPNADGHLLHYTLGVGRKEFNGQQWDFAASFLEELQSRGYDLTTLKFSVKKHSESAQSIPAVGQDVGAISE